jgi:hypothetical protein
MAKLTLEQIWKSATTLSPWRRNYTQNPKRQITSIVPFIGTRTVLFTASFWGLTSKSIHLTNILIHDCEIFEEQVVQQATQQPVTVQQAQNSKPSQPMQPSQPSKPLQPNQPAPYRPTGSTPQTPNQQTQPYGGVSLPYDSATHFKVIYNGKSYWVKKLDLRRQAVSIRCSCEDYFFCWTHANYIHGVQFGGRARPYVRVPGSTRPPKNPRNILGLCKHLSQVIAMLNNNGYVR